MTGATKELMAEMQKSVALLRTLRDEAKVKLHLAGMDAKTRWRELEPRIDAVVEAAKDVSEASQKAVAEAVKSVKKFHDSLR